MKNSQDKIQPNLIPRAVSAHGVTAKKSKNLWALANALLYLDTKLPDVVFDMGYYGSSLEESTVDTSLWPTMNLCGTAACAAGFGYQLMIGRSGDQRHPQALVEYVGYTSNALAFAGGTAFVWMFGSEWEFLDNTMKGAAERIAFFLCHPFDIGLEGPFTAEEPLMPSGLATANYTEGSLFSRWKEAFDWNVTPEIPGADDAVDEALKNADEYIRLAVKSQRVSELGPGEEVPQQT